MALKINLYKEKRTASENYSKVYGRVESNKIMTLDDMAEHMKDHNSNYSVGAIRGILTDLVACTREMVLNGIPVKYDDLAIFRPAITSRAADTVDDWNVTDHVKAVRMQCRATGKCTPKQLRADAQFGFTQLAQRIKAGELVLSNRKKEYISGVGGSGNAGGGSGEPTVTRKTSKRHV